MGQKPTVLDLFCGGGGFSYGFEESGFKSIGGIDFEAQAVETWNQNHNGNAIVGDITKYTPQKLMEELDIETGDVTVVVGGPPCKDFTNRNQTLDLGRNHLVTLYAEYVKEINPDAFVIENVRQLTTKYDDILETVYETLGEEYDIGHRLLDAADYGVPQHRIRAVVIGVRKDENEHPEGIRFPRPTHGPDSENESALISSGSALADIEPPENPDEYAITSKHAPLIDDIPPGMNYSFYTEKMGHPNPEFEWRSRFSDFLYKADPEKPIRTLKAKPGAASGPFHWSGRRFTESELKRLQSFPDTFTMPHGYTTVVKQIGNSVPPKMAGSIAESVKQLLGISPIAEERLITPDDSLGFYSRKRTPSSEYQEKATNRLKRLGLVEQSTEV